MEREFVPVSIGVVMVSDAPSTLDEATGKLIVDRLTEAGHTVSPIEVVSDSTDLVTARLQKWIRDTQMDVVIAMAGLDTDAARTALTPLITRPLAGFSDLFRMLTYNEIGTGAMLTEVIAAQCSSTYVFVLPASKGAVSTALEKILLPQLDHRTKPRNLVMRMPRHRPNGADLESSGPKAFPAEEHTPFGVPPAPARAARQTAVPPPPPRKRSPSVHGTPPMPLVVVPPPARSIADAEVAELDPAAVIEESTSLQADSMLEAAIEKSIETSGTPIDVTEAPPPPQPLDDNDPSIVAAREHAQKSPEMQAAAWVAAVEQAASKVVKRAVAEREARAAAEEAAREEPAREEPAREEVPPAAVPASAPVAAAQPDEIEAAALLEETPATDLDEELDEPRGKIEKATTGKSAPKADHAIDNVAAVIVDDPDLVERASRSRLASIKPATVVPLPPPRPVELDLPVFPARASGDLVARPEPKKAGTSWVLFGGVAVAAAVVLLVIVIGKRNKSVADSTPPPTPVSLAGNQVEQPPTPPVNPPTPPADPTATDIEMDPQHKTTDPKPTTVKDPPKDPVVTDPATDPKPKVPKVPKDPKVDPNDPDPAKAPTNPVNTGENCDEVSCILDKFARPCCERYKPADSGTGSGSGTAEKKPPVAAGPIELDKTLIRIGVERFRPQIIRCGEQGTTKGTVKLSVVVRADGMVDSVTVAETPDAALGNCAAAVMRKATFAKTQNGGSFTYPFEF
jgi:molybdopterin adenylyltransferase